MDEARSARSVPMVSRRRLRLPVAVALLLAASVSAVAAAAPTTGRGIGALDGDTIQVEAEGATLEIDLWGLDAPELEQPWGQAARSHLDGLVRGRDLQLEIRGGDPMVAVVHSDGDDLAAALLGAGLAWLPDSGDTDDAYGVALFMARSAGKGLWSGEEEEPVHPADWRRQQAELAARRPTPSPQRLSDIAHAIQIGEDGEPVAITVDDVPPTMVRGQEGQILAYRLRQIAGVRPLVARLELLHSVGCSPDALHGVEGEGTYWSDSQQRWVKISVQDAAADCDALRVHLDVTHNRLVAAKATAVAEARRFGLSDEDVDRLVGMYGLGDL